MTYGLGLKVDLILYAQIPCLRHGLKNLYSDTVFLLKENLYVQYNVTKKFILLI